MDVIGLHRRACEEFDRRVRYVRGDQWPLPTPCPGWSVRDLVNHVTAEDLWTPPLLAGATMEEVGDRFDGDQLGDDPQASWRSAVDAATAAAGRLESPDKIVHLSFGDHPASEYLMQLTADHLIHGWDLASAVEGDTRLDPELVDAVGDWFTGVEEFYRRAGAVADPPQVPADADAQTRLLARFGRTAV